MQEYTEARRGFRGEYAAYVGLDVHKETIAAAVAPAGREPPRYVGEIANRPAATAKLAKRMAADHGGEVILFSYEAGPCGYGLYRQLKDKSFDCEVVAPSRIPKAAAERIKTDRRDAGKLARLARSGDLTAVWVPDEEHEAIRDLVRARTDFKRAELRARQQLCAAPRPALVRRSLDQEALSVAGRSTVRSQRARVGVPGVPRRGAWPARARDGGDRTDG